MAGFERRKDWQPIFVDKDGVHIAMEYRAFGALNREAIEDKGTPIQDMTAHEATLELCYLAIRRHCNLMDEVVDAESDDVIVSRERDGGEAFEQVAAHRILQQIHESLITTGRLQVRLFDAAHGDTLDTEPIESFTIGD